MNIQLTLIRNNTPTTSVEDLAAIPRQSEFIERDGVFFRISRVAYVPASDATGHVASIQAESYTP